MKPFCELKSRILNWIPASGWDYELHDGSGILALLKRPQPLDSAMMGLTATEQWTFRRAAVSEINIFALETDDREPVAVFKLNQSKGTIHLSGGMRLTWKRTKNVKLLEWAFETEKGHLLLIFKPRIHRLTFDSIVEASPFALDHPQISLLALLGWYQLLTEHEKATSRSFVFSI